MKPTERTHMMYLSSASADARKWAQTSGQSTSGKIDLGQRKQAKVRVGSTKKTAAASASAKKTGRAR